MNFPETITTALLSGYSVFTTFTVEKDKRVKGFSKHLERLKINSEKLFGITPNRKEIIEQIELFLSQQPKNKKILVRIALFPENFSIVFPEKIEKIQIIITGRELSIPTKPLTLELHKNIRPLAHLKTSNLFSSLQTRKKAHENGYSDSLFFYEDIITEGPTWNIFFGKKGKNPEDKDILFFPDPSKKTFLDGFTQMLLKENISTDEYEIIITDILKKDLHQFDYCAIVSSGVGIVPVESIDDIHFSVNSIKKLQKIYNEIEGEEIK